jgi:hypothetical protein
MAPNLVEVTTEYSASEVLENIKSYINQNGNMRTGM